MKDQLYFPDKVKVPPIGNIMKDLSIHKQIVSKNVFDLLYFFEKIIPKQLGSILLPTFNASK